MPRKGHSKALLHIMDYLKLRQNSRSVFDSSYLDIDHSNFWECYLRDFYEGAVEAFSPDAPPPKVKEVDLHRFVYNNHAGNKQTRISRSMLRIYMNMSLINW